MRAKNKGSVLKYLHLNFMKFVRNFHEFEKIGFPKIRFCVFPCRDVSRVARVAREYLRYFRHIANLLQNMP